MDCNFVTYLHYKEILKGTKKKKFKKECSKAFVNPILVMGSIKVNFAGSSSALSNVFQAASGKISRACFFCLCIPYTSEKLGLEVGSLFDYRDIHSDRKVNQILI